MADVETKTPTEEQVKVEQKTTQEGEHAEEQKEAPAQRKFPTKWELIDQIKASEHNTVVLNIYKLNPEATWKDVKETYKEFSMKIDKVAKKEGMFNLYFRNHSDAISFIKSPIRPILDKKFFIRINEQAHHQSNDGWNQLGASGHTEKHETQKYYKSKAKKNFNKKPTEEGENAENQTEEKTENATTEKPTEETTETQHHQPRTRKISNEAKGTKPAFENKRFIGEANKPQITNSKKTVETKTETKAEEQKTEDSWNTVKDHNLEKKVAEDAKKKAERVKKEKEAEKKEQEKKKVEEVKQTATKKSTTSNFSDGWN